MTRTPVTHHAPGRLEVPPPSPWVVGLHRVFAFAAVAMMGAGSYFYGAHNELAPGAFAAALAYALCSLALAVAADREVKVWRSRRRFARLDWLRLVEIQAAAIDIGVHVRIDDRGATYLPAPAVNVVTLLAIRDRSPYAREYAAVRSNAVLAAASVIAADRTLRGLAAAGYRAVVARDPQHRAALWSQLFTAPVTPAAARRLEAHVTRTQQRVVFPTGRAPRRSTRQR